MVRVRGREVGALGAVVGCVADGGYDGDATVVVVALVADGAGEFIRDGPGGGRGEALEDGEDGV